MHGSAGPRSAIPDQFPKGKLQGTLAKRLRQMVGCALTKHRRSSLCIDYTMSVATSHGIPAIATPLLRKCIVRLRTNLTLDERTIETSFALGKFIQIMGGGREHSALARGRSQMDYPMVHSCSDLKERQKITVTQ